MQKFGEFVCKHKRIILIIMLILLIPSIIGMKATRINYDILVYLPDDIETIQGENILSEDFNMGAFSIILLEDMETKDILKLEDEIKQVDNVAKVISGADVLGTSIPVEMLPDEVKDELYKDNTTVMLVTFKEAISSDATMNTVQHLRDITDKHCKISGMTATLLDTRDLSNSEVAIYVVIAVVLCLIVLEIALDSYVAPILLLANIGIAILYNMGTNIFLGEISYITKAISAVLQLGVTMDFAIFLYHSYQAELKNTTDRNQAMSIAISKTFTSVLGSSLTTIAGFLALCSMNLTLGKDIGIVMAKGVLFGVISVVTILPSLILMFDKAIQKTKHKELLPKFTTISEFNIKHYKAIIVIFLIALPIALYGYNNTKVYYKLDSSLPETLDSISANNTLKDKFGLVSQEMILINKDTPNDEINEMLDVVIADLSRLEKSFDNGKILKDGVKTAIIGKPNAGKSSLLNCILNEERAIVTEIEGTTRDTIEEFVTVEGVPLKLIDTAGIREAKDEVEKIGITKSKEIAKDADLIIAIFDSSKDLTDEDKEILDIIKNKTAIVVLNKMDLLNKIDENMAEIKNVSKYIVKMSTLEQKGIDDLYKSIGNLFSMEEISLDNTIVITNIRHKNLISKALNSCREAKKSMELGMPLDIIAIFLKEILENLGEITGETVTDDIIDEIFSKFCLGK